MFPLVKYVLYCDPYLFPFWLNPELAPCHPSADPPQPLMEPDQTERSADLYSIHPERLHNSSHDHAEYLCASYQ